jgi:hypothetical protein
MNVAQQPDAPFSRRLSAWTDEGDRIFNHLLGYVIAITSLVAFADVLSNGQITQYLPGVYWVWLIAQGLGVEFQVFILIRRLPTLWKKHRGLFILNTFFIVCLCLMSIVIGSVFVQHDNAGGTIEQAMRVLGINHTAFVYARSALAIMLVVIIAIDRALEQQQQTCTPAITEQADRTDATLRALVDRVAELTVTVTQITTTVTQITTANARLDQGEHRALSEGDQGERKLIAAISDRDQVIAANDHDASVGDRIRSALTDDPTLSIRELAAIAGCSSSTANKWKRRVVV